MWSGSDAFIHLFFQSHQKLTALADKTIPLFEDYYEPVAPPGYVKTKIALKQMLMFDGHL